MMQSHAMVPHHLRLWDKDWDLENDPLAKYYNKAPSTGTVSHYAGS